jgi:hypothetical protein
MAFAKMQCPIELRESYLLLDKDFEQAPDTDEMDIAEASSADQESAGARSADGFSQEELNANFIVKQGNVENSEIDYLQGELANVTSKDESVEPATAADGRIVDDESKSVPEKKTIIDTTGKKEKNSKGATKGKVQKDSNMADKAVKLRLFT